MAKRINSVEKYLDINEVVLSNNKIRHFEDTGAYYNKNKLENYIDYYCDEEVKSTSFSKGNYFENAFIYRHASLGDTNHYIVDYNIFKNCCIQVFYDVRYDDYNINLVFKNSVIDNSSILNSIDRNLKKCYINNSIIINSAILSVESFKNNSVFNSSVFDFTELRDNTFINCNISANGDFFERNIPKITNCNFLNSVILYPFKDLEYISMFMIENTFDNCMFIPILSEEFIRSNKSSKKLDDFESKNKLFYNMFNSINTFKNCNMNGSFVITRRIDGREGITNLYKILSMVEPLRASLDKK